VPFAQLGILGLLADDGIFTTASLKWSTTAAMAKTPPSRSYRLFSGTVCLSCACALSAAAKTVTGAAASASPPTTLRLVIEVETICDMATSGARTTERDEAEWDDRTLIGSPPAFWPDAVVSVSRNRASVRDLMQQGGGGSRKSIDADEPVRGCPLGSRASV
jgi:hypothetical protein